MTTEAPADPNRRARSKYTGKIAEKQLTAPFFRGFLAVWDFKGVFTGKIPGFPGTRREVRFDRWITIEERLPDPIICELWPGPCHLVLRRGDEVLYEEWFQVPRGRSVVITAWDPAAHGMASEPGD